MVDTNSSKQVRSKFGWGIAAAIACAGATSVGILAAGGLTPEPSNAVVFSDGRVAFDSPPLMVDTSHAPSTTSTRNGTFRFAFEVPPNAGEPLAYVEIVPYSGVEDIEFRLNNITAYGGASLRGGPSVPVQGFPISANYEPGDNNAEAIGVIFDPPVQPGNIVTVVLKSLRNPRRGGSYLYDVTVYPDANVGVGQRMGFARFSFYERGGNCDRISC